MFELGQFDRCLLDEVLDDILLAQPVAAAHGVVEMIIEAVIRTLDPSRATLRRHGVAAHRIDLRDQRDLQRRIGFGHRNGCTQTGSPSPHDDYICFVDFHAQSFLAQRELCYDLRKCGVGKRAPTVLDA